MQKITFEITEDEVREVAGRKLTRKQVKEILTMVECDHILWNDIEESIKDAVDQFPKILTSS